MSEKYEKVAAFRCGVCGELHTSPALAENCYVECHARRLMEEIAELRLRGGVNDADTEHMKSERASMLDDLEEARDELEAMFGDDCDHNECMKQVQVDGGTYCHECDEQVNELPEDPQTFTL